MKTDIKYSGRRKSQDESPGFALIKEGRGGASNYGGSHRKAARAKEREIETKNKKCLEYDYWMSNKVYLDLLSSKIPLL